MISRYRVKYEPPAVVALEEAAAYIQEDGSDERATRWLRAVLESIEKLETLPRAFGMWTTREGQEIRSKLVKPYRVFYVVDDSTATVSIIDVVHTAQETKLAPYRDVQERRTDVNEGTAKSDLQRLDALGDDQIDYTDLPKLDEALFRKAQVVESPGKSHLDTRLKPKP